MNLRELFYGTLAGNIAISLVFLTGRLIDGMPAYEAFGKFFLAVILTAIITYGAIGMGMFFSAVFSPRKGKW
jgi:hypothetical protein